MVCATTDFSVILQVSGNKLRVTEIDGYEIEEIMVDKLMLNPGQTAIVHLEPITLNTENHFWIRVQEGAVSAGKAQWRRDHKPRYFEILVFSLLCFLNLLYISSIYVERTLGP